MSRVAKNPVVLPAGVEAKIEGQRLTIKGSKGSLQQNIPQCVKVEIADKALQFSPITSATVAGESAMAAGEPIAANADAIAGSIRATAQNMVTGVSQGFERKLVLVGVGYRAAAQGSKLALTLGFSHPVEYIVPEGIKVETPSQTEIVIKGVDKQVVGQVAAEIRAYRPPEPYKGKGVRYANEAIILKEAKKK